MKKKTGRRNLGLSEQRSKWTVVLHRNVKEQEYIHEQIDEMVDRGEWQTWIRENLMRLLPMPANWQPKTNGHLEERYADPEDSA